MTHPEQGHPDRLAEIKQRAENATRGPWTTSYDSCDCDEPCRCGMWVFMLNLPKEHVPDGYDYRVTEIADLTIESAEFVAHAPEDIVYLIAEVERLRAALAAKADVAQRLLSNVEQFAGDHLDPGTEALAAIWEARQLLRGHVPPPDDLVERAAEAVAGVLGHTLEWDTPEGPCCDNTLGCGRHDPEPGCADCAAPGWPCETALSAARAALSAVTALAAKAGAE